jgi:hypothetical protein
LDCENCVFEVLSYLLHTLRVPHSIVSNIWVGWEWRNPNYGERLSFFIH